MLAKDFENIDNSRAVVLLIPLHPWFGHGTAANEKPRRSKGTEKGTSMTIDVVHGLDKQISIKNYQILVGC